MIYEMYKALENLFLIETWYWESNYKSLDLRHQDEEAKTGRAVYTLQGYYIQKH